MEMNRYVTLAKTMGTVAQVFSWVALIAGFLSLLAIPIFHLALSPSSFLISEGHFPGLNVGLISFELTSAAPGSSMLPVMTTIMAMATVLFTVLAYGINKIRAILATVQHGNPFAPANAARLKVISFLLVIGAFLGNAGQYMVVQQMISALKLTGVTARYSVNTGMLLAGFMLLVLAGVFQYGSLLQQEADSTI